MGTQQGDLSLLDSPVAKGLLESAIPARLSYVWHDGTPRVVPIWFHWNGTEVVVCSPTGAPKLNVLKDGSKVALTIDENAFPWKVLLIRGTVAYELVNEPVTEEYAAAAKRYLGEEGGSSFVEQIKGMGSSQMGRLKITPEWVGLLDFETRWPSAVEALMAG